MTGYDNSSNIAHSDAGAGLVAAKLYEKIDRVLDTICIS